MMKKSMRVFLLCGALAGAVAAAGCVPLVAAGVGATALSIGDRRTTGAQIEDEAIEGKTSSRLAEQFGSAHYQVNVTSYNRRVLLTGQASTAEVRNKLAEIAKSVPNVTAVTNEVIVAGSSSLTARSNDGLITSNVKTRLLTNNEGRFYPNHIKVVSENGTVYLLGIVTQAEGDAAAEIARKSSGAQRVVKVFEYIDRAPEAKN